MQATNVKLEKTMKNGAKLNTGKNEVLGIYVST